MALLSRQITSFLPKSRRDQNDQRYYTFVYFCSKFGAILCKMLARVFFVVYCSGSTARFFAFFLFLSFFFGQSCRRAATGCLRRSTNRSLNPDFRTRTGETRTIKHAYVDPEISKLILRPKFCRIKVFLVLKFVVEVGLSSLLPSCAVPHVLGAVCCPKYFGYRSQDFFLGFDSFCTGYGPV